MRKILNYLLVFVLFAVSLGGERNVAAAVTVAQPQNVKVTVDNYYTYWDKHRSELEKAGYVQGDGCDAFVSWNKVSGANGYQVKLTWDEEGTLSTTVVNVKKAEGKYVYTTKGGAYESHYIASSTGKSIKEGVKNKICSKRLAFYVTASGSVIEISKVKVRAYRIVNNRKVYGKFKTVSV
jgi:hypothetical protein